MTRLHGVIFAFVATGLGTAMIAAGCSSSSSPASPSQDSGTEANVAITPDAASLRGAQTTVTVQWKIVDLSSPPPDGGTDAGSDGGESDGGESDGGEIDVDSGDGDASAGDANDGATADAPVEESDAAGDDGAAQDGGVTVNALPGLPGVTVCVYTNSAVPCVTTQGDGTFSMPGLPVRSDIVLSLKKEGYLSYLLPIETASTDTDERTSPVYMGKPGPTAPAIGVPINFTDKGAIDAFALVAQGAAAMNMLTTTAGTAVSIDPMTANGPFYLDNGGGYVHDAGTFQGGATALFYNVDPGMYTLTYANPSYDCEPISFPFGGFGWPVPSPPHSLKVVVAAGYVTGIVGALCTPYPKIVPTDGG
jgi:hypothetical protein